MASHKVIIFLFALLHATFLLSSLVCCDDEEDHLLQGLNGYRTSLHLPTFAKNDNVGCVADQVADKLEDQPCTSANGVNNTSANAFLLDDHPEILSKCDIDINHTRDGVILPVCVPKLVPTLVLTNYTLTPYVRYINDSKFTGAGFGSENDWMVVVLSTNNSAGNFASGAYSLVSNVDLGYCLVSFFLGMFVYLLY